MISVIIPTYNRAQYICETIDSVLAQTYKDYEIIVVDDGSTDNTKELLAKYNGKIQYVYKTNSGVSAARNLGINLSKGEYLAFLDSDDMWLPEKLEKQMGAINEDSIGLIHTAKYMIDAKGKLTGDVRPRYPAKNLDDLLNNYHICMSVLVKKDLVKKAGMFDETISGSEDKDLWIRIAKIAKIKFIDDPLIKYRVHSDNTCNDCEKIYTGHVKTFEKLRKDKDMKVHKRLIKNRLASEYYLLARAQYEKGKYKDALHSLLQALNADIFLFNNFIYKEDKFIMKVKKLLNPFAALCVYSLKALLEGK
ncbi:MAG: glycosyltransferase [Candidatus Omnitrophota bacterium]|nr:glycosyltransferase [Candidatus Omnitrophota bacterium]